MHKWALVVLFSLFSLTAYASKSEIDIDWDIVEIEWQFIKKQVGAPADLPMPPIHLKELPPGARMMFQFPLTDGDEAMEITIAPTTLTQYSREMLNWAVGHELTHYAFIMRENFWDHTKTVYQHAIYNVHHCNQEFMNITRAIANIIWNSYHSERERYAMWDQVQRSCLMQPNQ